MELEIKQMMHEIDLKMLKNNIKYDTIAENNIAD